MFKTLANNSISRSPVALYFFNWFFSGLWGIWSCLLVCHMILLRIPYTVQNYGGHLRSWIVLFPSREDLFCFWEAVRVGKITLIQLMMEQMEKWVINLVRQALFPVTPPPEIHFSGGVYLPESQLEVRDVYLDPFFLAYFKFNFILQDL